MLVQSCIFLKFVSDKNPRKNYAILGFEMAEEGKLPPWVQTSPGYRHLQKKHSHDEGINTFSEKKGKKRTPSPKRSTGKNPAKRRRKHSTSSSGSPSSSSSDSDSASNSDKSPSRKRNAKRSERTNTQNTSTPTDGDVYVRFSAAKESAPKPQLSEDMIGYLYRTNFPLM